MVNEFVNVKIVDSSEYDLIGEVINKLFSWLRTFFVY
jgi:hypothetical protein